MAEATVNINSNASDSNVTPDSLKVNDGETVTWQPVGGTINHFTFDDTSVFSSQPHQVSDSDNWEAVMDKNAPAEIDNYTVNVTNDAGSTFTIDPNLKVQQGGG